MSLQPQGESVRKAVRWISGERQDHPEIPLSRLIEQACLTFNLSPLDADALSRLFTTGAPGGDVTSFPK